MIGNCPAPRNVNANIDDRAPTAHIDVGTIAVVPGSITPLSTGRPAAGARARFDGSRQAGSHRGDRQWMTAYPRIFAPVSTGGSSRPFDPRQQVPASTASTSTHNSSVSSYVEQVHGWWGLGALLGTRPAHRRISSNSNLTGIPSRDTAGRLYLLITNSAANTTYPVDADPSALSRALSNGHVGFANPSVSGRAAQVLASTME